MIEAKPADGVSLDTLRTVIWEELEKLRTALVGDEELTKVKNKVENSIVFSEMSIVNKAINLCFFEALGDVELINSESQTYQDISAAQLQQFAHQFFVQEKCSELIYLQDPKLRVE